MKSDDGISLALVGSLASLLAAIALLIYVALKHHSNDIHQWHRLQIEVEVEYE